jgi:hypothetical protein
VTWDGAGKDAFGKLFRAFMGLTRGSFIRRSLQFGFDRIEAIGYLDGQTLAGRQTNAG